MNESIRTLNLTKVLGKRQDKKENNATHLHTAISDTTCKRTLRRLSSNKPDQEEGGVVVVVLVLFVLLFALVVVVVLVVLVLFVLFVLLVVAVVKPFKPWDTNNSWRPDRNKARTS